jgi:hypothetical protein
MVKNGLISAHAKPMIGQEYPARQENRKVRGNATDPANNDALFYLLL